jgi:hypothetical protein
MARLQAWKDYYICRDYDKCWPGLPKSMVKKQAPGITGSAKTAAAELRVSPSTVDTEDSPS